MTDDVLPSRRLSRPHQAIVQAAAALGDAVALIDIVDADILHATPALLNLVPGAVSDSSSLAAWDAALPGLSDGVRTARSIDRHWHCGGEQAFKAEAAALDERHVLLRLRDEREARRENLESLRRQLDDREQLLFTSRAVSVGEMGSTLAHELNQPIGAAANLLRGLRLRLSRRAGDLAAQEELHAVERAIEQVMFAARIIARIREFTHSRAPRLEPVDVGALIRSSASLLDWDLQRMKVRLTLDLPATPLVVRGDEVMLQQVLINLLRNAIDALRDAPPADPEIALSLRRDGEDAHASLRDNGCGMGAEAEQRLFVPFTSTKPTGMGIGLSICRSFVELHQGRLWFSRNPDRGSTFHLSLPLHRAGTHPQESR